MSDGMQRNFGTKATDTEGVNGNGKAREGGGRVGKEIRKVKRKRKKGLTTHVLLHVFRHIGILDNSVASLARHSKLFKDLLVCGVNKKGSVYKRITDA